MTSTAQENRWTDNRTLRARIGLTVVNRFWWQIGEVWSEGMEWETLRHAIEWLADHRDLLPQRGQAEISFEVEASVTWRRSPWSWRAPEEIDIERESYRVVKCCPEGARQLAWDIGPSIYDYQCDKERPNG